VSQIVRKAVYFLMKKCGFAKKASFYLKKVISAINLKEPVKFLL